MDSSRLRTGEIVAGIGGLLLFVFLFFDWYGGGVQVSGSVLGGTATLEETGVSGWDALTDVPGFVIMLSGVSGIALAYLGAAGSRVNIPVQRGAVTAYLGALAVLLILWRMVAGSPTLKIGIFLGLAAVIMITAGAVMALREDGYQLLVSVPGGRTRVAAASPPPAMPAPASAAPASAAPPAAPTATATRSSGSTATRKSTTPKSPARKSTPRKSTARKSSAGKSTARKSTARKSTAKKSTAGKSTARKSSGSRSSGGRKRSSGGSK